LFAAFIWTSYNHDRQSKSRHFSSTQKNTYSAVRKNTLETNIQTSGRLLYPVDRGKLQKHVRITKLRSITETGRRRSVTTAVYASHTTAA